MRGGLILAREVSSEEGLYTQLWSHRGETSDPFLLLPSRKTGLINSKGSSRTGAACVSSTWAFPGNKDPHPRELHLLLPGTTTQVAYACPGQPSTLPARRPHSQGWPRASLGLQLEYQGWIVLEFGGYVDIQKAETKKMHLSKEIQQVS